MHWHNGWLPSGTAGRWEISSIGEVVHGGQRMLIAALSEGSATEDSGISLVQTVAGAAAGAMAASKANGARLDVEQLDVEQA